MMNYANYDDNFQNPDPHEDAPRRKHEEYVPEERDLDKYPLLDPKLYYKRRLPRTMAELHAMYDKWDGYSYVPYDARVVRLLMRALEMAATEREDYDMTADDWLIRAQENTNDR